MKSLYTISIILLLSLSACIHPDFCEDLGEGYEYCYEGLELNEIYKYLDSTTVLRIPGMIMKYEYDDNYIIASQLYVPNTFTYTHEVEEYIALHSDSLNYWIIEKKANILHASMNKKEFDSIINELGVSIKLKL